MSSSSSRRPIVADVQGLVRRAIEDGKAYQQRLGVAPNIIVKRHHDHLTTLFSGQEASYSGWPMCLRCKHIVEGYGVGDQNSKEVEVYAECHGQKVGHWIRKPYPDVMEIEPGWLNEVTRLLTFFTPVLS